MTAVPVAPAFDYTGAPSKLPHYERLRSPCLHGPMDYRRCSIELAIQWLCSWKMPRTSFVPTNLNNSRDQIPCRVSGSPGGRRLRGIEIPLGEAARPCQVGEVCRAGLDDAETQRGQGGKCLRISIQKRWRAPSNQRCLRARVRYAGFISHSNPERFWGIPRLKQGSPRSVFQPQAVHEDDLRYPACTGRYRADVKSAQHNARLI